MIPKIIRKKCVGCGECAIECLSDAIRISKKTGIARINYDKCVGCGVCIDICPIKAIRKKNG